MTSVALFPRFAGARAEKKTMLRAVVVSALCLVVVSAQRPSRCVSPPQWEGRLIEIDPSKRFERRANLSYDATNQRVRTIDEIEEGSERDFYDEISLFEKKIHYSVNLKTRQCNKTALDKEFRPVEVPLFANFTDEVYLGISGLIGAGVLENIFQGNDADKGRYSGAWTELYCIPVTDTYLSMSTGYVHWSFYDVSPGIKNVDVFNPPPECQ
jgi:hypothetical protein